MNLDLNKINHQYVVRMVIFSIFTYRRLIRNPEIYKQTIIRFLDKKLMWKINLTITIPGSEKSIEDRRDKIFRSILYKEPVDFLNKVIVQFTTSYKEVTFEIDLRDIDKFENFLHL